MIRSQIPVSRMLVSLDFDIEPNSILTLRPCMLHGWQTGTQVTDITDVFDHDIGANPDQSG